jgi:hypothetical protein
MRYLQFARALSERHHDPRPFVIRHAKPARNLIARPKAAGAHIAGVELANVSAWRRDIHAGNKSQNQKPFVARGPVLGQTYVELESPG